MEIRKQKTDELCLFTIYLIEIHLFHMYQGCVKYITKNKCQSKYRNMVYANQFLTISSYGHFNVAAFIIYEKKSELFISKLSRQTPPLITPLPWTCDRQFTIYMWSSETKIWPLHHLIHFTYFCIATHFGIFKLDILSVNVKIQTSVYWSKYPKKYPKYPRISKKYPKISKKNILKKYQKKVSIIENPVAV